MSKKNPTESNPNVFQEIITDNGAEYLGAGAEFVVNAMVTLTNQDDSKTVFRGTTNKRGEFYILVSVEGSYMLKITGDDIATLEINLEINSNIKLNFTVNRTLTDIDGNVYKTVKIGEQWVLAENLKVTRYRNGEDIQNVTNGLILFNLRTGAYCNYDNDSSNVTIYGRLYNWFAVNDSRNIAPEGWHVPTAEEWTTLFIYLGEIKIAGGKMKESSTIHWESPNTGATNESGFSALPSGKCSGIGKFYGLGRYFNFWTASKYDSQAAYGRRLDYNSMDVWHFAADNQCGYSVRLFRD